MTYTYIYDLLITISVFNTADERKLNAEMYKINLILFN